MLAWFSFSGDLCVLHPWIAQIVWNLFQKHQKWEQEVIMIMICYDCNKLQLRAFLLMLFCQFLVSRSSLFIVCIMLDMVLSAWSQLDAPHVNILVKKSGFVAPFSILEFLNSWNSFTLSSYAYLLCIFTIGIISNMPFQNF